MASEHGEQLLHRPLAAAGHAESPPVLIAIPCLNEEAHIADILDFARTEADRYPAPVTIVVADGGSTDGSRSIVEEVAKRDMRVRLIHNARRIQSAGINLAVAECGPPDGVLVRIDAHAGYQPGLLRILVDAKHERGVDAVVVSMRAEASPSNFFQQIVAAAQNTRLGHGGSAHRCKSAGRYVDHGHHALIDLDRFRELGGYDEAFSHNEDAEFDHRLTTAGGRIWLTGETEIRYFPRKKPLQLFRQYYNHGRGRAANLCKHRKLPRMRQFVVLMVAPALVAALLSPLWPPLALPLVGWIAFNIAYGVAAGTRDRRIATALLGFATIIMHLGWSLGFWRGALLSGFGHARRG